MILRFNKIEVLQSQDQAEKHLKERHSLETWSMEWNEMDFWNWDLNWTESHLKSLKSILKSILKSPLKSISKVISKVIITALKLMSGLWVHWDYSVRSACYGKKSFSSHRVKYISAMLSSMFSEEWPRTKDQDQGPRTKDKDQGPRI